MRFLVVFFLVLTTICKAQLSGTINVPATYSSLATALSVLNANGVSAPVMIVVASTHTEVAPANGFTISASGSAVNQITITGASAVQRPVLIAPPNGSKNPSSSMQDGVVRIIGSDYLEFRNFEIKDLNAAAPQSMEFGIGLFNASAIDGCNHVTIKNCKISLNASNNAAGNLPAVDGSRGIEVVNALSAAHTTSINVTNQSGAHSFNCISGNFIEQCNYGIVFIGSQDAAPYIMANLSNTIGGVSASAANTVSTFGGGGSNAAAGIRLSAQYQCLVANNVVISGNGITSKHQGTLRGIYVNAAPEASNNILSNYISLHSGASTAQMIGIENQGGAQGSSNLVRLCNNTITACSYSTATTGNFYAVFNSASAARLQIDSNSVLNNSTGAGSGATNVLYNTGAVSKYCSFSFNQLDMKFSGNAAYQGNLCLINSANSGTACSIKIVGNLFGNIVNAVLPGSAVIQFISNTADADSLQINANRWQNIHLNHTGVNYMIQNMSSVGAWLAVCSNSVSNYSRLQAGNTWFYYANSIGNINAIETFSGNLISDVNFLNTGNATFIAFQCTNGGQSPFPAKKIYDNVVRNVSTAGGVGFTAFQLSDLGASSTISRNRVENISVAENCNAVVLSSPVYTAGAITVKANTITALSANGSTASVNGMVLTAANASLECGFNKISDLTSSTISGSVSGIYINSAGNFTLHHNVLANLNAAVSNGQHRVNGIYVGTAAQLKVFYNTIKLQAASSGTLFGSNAFYCSTTPGLELRNNILINLSVASGSALTVAYRRSSTSITNYSLNSNNNIFYAGTPSAQNVLYYNGSSSYQTITTLQSALSPRENLSLSTIVPFRSNSSTSVYFLHLADNVVNAAESAAQAILGFSIDIDAAIRQGNVGYLGTGTAPDCGADEANTAINSCSTAANYTLAGGASTICAGQFATLSPAGESNGTGLQYQWETATASTSFSAVPSATNLEASLSFTSPGIYFLRLRNTCSANNLFSVTGIYTLQVNAVPTVSAVASQTVCSNLSVSLAAVGNAQSYYWIGPAAFTATTATAILPSVQNYHAGTYSLIAANANCAAATITTQVIVDVVTLNVTSSEQSICSGASCTLMATGIAVNYVWNSIINSASIVVTPSVTTAYTLQAISNNSCVTTETIMVSVVQPTISANNATLCLPSSSATLSVNSFTPSYINWYLSSNAVWPIASSATLPVSTTTSTQRFVYAALMNNKQFSTTVTSGTNCAMQMFDVQAQVPLSISRFELPVLSSGTCMVTVYARQGSFQSYSTTAAGWSIVSSSLISTTTNSAASMVSIDLEYFIPGAQTAAFAIAVSSNSLLCAVAGNSVVSNTDLNIPQVYGGALFSVTQNSANFQGNVLYKKQSCASNLIAVQVAVNTSPVLSISPQSLVVCPSKQFSLSASGASSYLWSNASTSASLVSSITSATVISVTGTSAGCSSTASISVLTHSIFTPTITASATSVCPNQAVQLTAGALQSYTWSTGPNTPSVLVSPAAPSTYTLYGSDSNLCFVSNTISIGTKTVPLLSILPVPEKFCAGETVTLFAAGALSYTWLPSSTTGNTTSVLPNSNQVIIALGTGVNTCTSTAYILLEPDACLLAGEITEDIKLRIYPQPAGHFFTIESDIVIEQLNFFSGNGQIIERKTINGKNENVYVDELEAGLYIVEVKLQTGQIIYRKLIKQ